MSVKNPPIFNPEVDDDYMSWKRDVGVWKLFTETKAEKQGAAVYLSLQGKARECVRPLDTNKIGSATGFDEVLAQLDKTYLVDETTRMFCALKEFYEYRRESGIDFSAPVLVLRSISRMRIERRIASHPKARRRLKTLRRMRN